MESLAIGNGWPWRRALKLELACQKERRGTGESSYG
jgi:hypothetical protein